MAVDRQALLRNADRAVRKGDMARAVQFYQQLVDAFPSDRALLQKLGDAQARAGDDAAGQATLVRLAELYREDGDKSRSLALLKRAVNLGGRNPELLARLGEWMLASSLLADARAPLIEAAEAFLRRSQPEQARDAARQLLEIHPADSKALGLLAEALAQLPISAEDGAVFFELARGLSLNGDAAGAADAFERSLEADGGAQLSSPRRRSVLGEVWSRIAASEGAPGIGENASPAMRIVEADRLATNAQGPASTALLLSVGDDPTVPTLLRIIAAKTLLERGDAGAASRIVVDASRSPTAEFPAASPEQVIEALTSILTRDPGQQAAMDRLVELSPEIGGVGQTGAAAPAAPEAAASRASRETQIDAALRAKLLEARTLIEHAMPDRALEALAGLSEPQRAIPEVAELCRRAESLLSARRTPSPRRPETPEKLQAGPGQSAPDGDEWEISFDEDETGRADALTAGRSGEDEGADTAPADAEAPAEAPLGELGDHLVAAIDDDDDETRYQMAIGLLEMGVESQAGPLLDGLLSSPVRGLDAAAALLKARVARGDLAGALHAGTTALATVPGEPRSERRLQLLALTIQVAVESGEQAKARELLESMRAAASGHEVLQKLESWIASRR